MRGFSYDGVTRLEIEATTVEIDRQLESPRYDAALVTP
jgi:hypothetical protein